ncbi:hypothetical protein IMW75_11765 [Pseudomonas gregormendelii]|uniref:Uncharacterized protein n=1 Tax=Pseudomonas gregormendelii TaxID=1628277 RepID=A0ABS3AGJ7_9PSED|nr:hypothetical protein [Pseudomonas gregormendelii]MBN3965951.1 hypothetical protein [Pseudomonas gregormendelii]
MATAKPVANIGIQSKSSFPDPEAEHAKDSWTASLKGSRNAPGSLYSISSKCKVSDDEKNLWQKIVYFLRHTFCASNRFFHVDRSTPRAVSFDVLAIKKSIPGDPVHIDARGKIQTLDQECCLLHAHYEHFANASTTGDHSSSKMREIRQTNQSLLDDCIKLKAALGKKSSHDIGLDVLITAYQSPFQGLRVDAPTTPNHD